MMDPTSNSRFSVSRPAFIAILLFVVLLNIVWIVVDDGSVGRTLSVIRWKTQISAKYINGKAPSIITLNDQASVSDAAFSQSEGILEAFPTTPDTASPAKPSSSCTWSPTHNDTECRELIVSRLCSHKSDRLGRRVLFFGDSTVGPNRLFKDLQDHFKEDQFVANLDSVCPGLYSCSFRFGSHCRSNLAYGLQYPANNVWRPPNLDLGEGPVVFGLTHHFCSDCAQCRTTVRVCSLANESQSCLDTIQRADNVQDPLKQQNSSLVYGGFIKAEFARDVEMQSDLFTTTQENNAVFINASYNSDGLVRDWGKPYCIVSTAHHDAGIQNMTREKYLANVEWYLGVLNSHCESIIWLGATAPKQTEPFPYPQTVNQTRSWNAGVQEIVERMPELNTVFMDVLEASRLAEHHDNIHMGGDWYQVLASFFWSVVSTKC
ncbi:hypothetical protein MPSEU_000310300 [Mayamaea pseudoterrestris]|nr:hypothetical protein MPSEU_000310300 [Mayamaea pseudoterrestris]